MIFDDPNHPRKSKERKPGSKSDRHHSKSRRHGKRKSRGRRGGSMTIAQFCPRHSIGRSTFYDLCKRGLGPRLMRIGRAVRISFEAERDWVKQMESQVAAPVPALADIVLEDLEDIEAIGTSAKQDNETDGADEQNDESETSDEIRVKPKKTRRRRRRKHRHVHSERRDLVLRLDALNPEHSGERDDAIAREHGAKRETKHKKTRKHGQGKHSRHHRDE